MIRRLGACALVGLFQLALGCGDTSADTERDAGASPAHETRDGSSRADAPVDAPSEARVESGSEAHEGSSDAEAIPLSDGELPPHAAKLPFDYERPESGEPVSAADIAEATRLYLELLDETRYFDVLDERVHGWPEDDPKKRYWFGTWWGDSNVVKKDGKVTFFHGPFGADNNGIDTGPMMESACYAYLAWKNPKIAHLTRRMMRGMVAWILAMEREPNDPDAPILSRSFYPESIGTKDRGNAVFIDYSLNRPGLGNEPSAYVHLPNNPTFGDVWVKNTRSKDDIGWMLKGIAEIEPCLEALRGTDFEPDALDLRKRYSAWARTVEDHGFAIPTLDVDAKYSVPPGDGTNYVLLQDLECDGALALRLLGRGDPGTLDCKNGVSGLDKLISNSNHQNGEILRSHHQAAVAWALRTGHDDVAKALLVGLADRMDLALDAALSGKDLPYVSFETLAGMLVAQANVGVPLTWREVRYLHERIRQAHQSYLLDTLGPADPWDPATPDGTYPLGPWGSGFEPRSIGELIGTCVAQYRNPKSKPVLDCKQLLAHGA